MSVAAVKIKIMPESAEASIKEIEADVKKVLESQGVKNPNFEIQLIAFGLKAIVAMFGWPEEKELDTLETKLSHVKNVGSVQILDIRRAIG